MYIFSGLERLMQPGPSALDPHWMDLQRRYAYPPGQMMPNPNGGASGSNPHIPGVYPPSSLSSDLLARERERLERLGMSSLTSRVVWSVLALSVQEVHALLASHVGCRFVLSCQPSQSSNEPITCLKRFRPFNHQRDVCLKLIWDRFRTLLHRP